MSFIKGYAHSLCQKYTLPDDVKKMDNEIRQLLVNRGYLSLPQYHMLQPRRVYPCSWCRKTYGTTDAQIVMALYLNHDNLVLDMDYIDIRSNAKVKYLDYMLDNHPDKSCPFVETQLFRKVYEDDEDSLMPEKILRRKFHSDFYVKDILWRYIKNNENKRLYDMVMRIDPKTINYIFKSDTTNEEIERFAKYVGQLREKYREDETQIKDNNPFKIASRVSPFNYFDMMPVIIKPGINYITVEFHAPFLDEFSKRSSDVDCYHANLRLIHCMKLGKELTKYCDVIMNLNIIEECFCDCPEQPAVSEYPKEDTLYKKTDN